LAQASLFAGKCSRKVKYPAKGILSRRQMLLRVGPLPEWNHLR